MSKVCSKCGRDLPLSEYYKHEHSKDGLRTYCKDCCSNKSHDLYLKRKDNPDYKKRVAEYGKAWYEDNGERLRAKHRADERKKREMVICHYGGCCDCCGEDRYEFLSVDHIDGGGGKHREEIGNHIIRWLIKNNYPDGFRILCHNCNQALGHYGYCPHEEMKVVDLEHRHH